MKLAVFSYKVCWKTENSPSGYATDGGFPIQMRAIASLFDETRLVVPVPDQPASDRILSGLTPLKGHQLSIVPLPVPRGEGLRRKIGLFGWMTRALPIINQQLNWADAVHAPIPGDIGTFGMLGAEWKKKPLFVRHCGNWRVQATMAERFWKSHMIKRAGGVNVMLATGGGDDAPSTVNPNVHWIFSTSLSQTDIERLQPPGFQSRPWRQNGPRLIIAARQDPEKGAGVVIEALPGVMQEFPQAQFDIVGDGAGIASFRATADRLGVANRVRFHGKVSQARVIELLRDADLFCFPTAASDGFPKAVHEALACGLPVIATRVSVLPSLLREGGGVLIDERTPLAIQSAVSRCYQDSNSYQKLSSEAALLARRYTLEGWRNEIGDHLTKAWKCPLSTFNQGANLL